MLIREGFPAICVTQTEAQHEIFLIKSQGISVVFVYGSIILLLIIIYNRNTNLQDFHQCLIEINVLNEIEPSWAFKDGGAQILITETKLFQRLRSKK